MTEEQRQAVENAIAFMAGAIAWATGATQEHEEPIAHVAAVALGAYLGWCDSNPFEAMLVSSAKADTNINPGELF